MAKPPVKVEPLELEPGRYVLQIEWTGSHASSMVVDTCSDLDEAQMRATQLYNLLWRVFHEGQAALRAPG